MKCKRCGREFTGNFCPQCGQRAEEVEQAPAVQQREVQGAEATEQAPAVQQREVQGALAACFGAIIAWAVVCCILGVFLPKNLLWEESGSAVIIELLIFWLAIVLVTSFFSGLSGLRLSPEEIKNIRALQKRGGGLGRGGKR